MGIIANEACFFFSFVGMGQDLTAPPMHAPSRAPLLLPLLRSHNLPFPRVH
jgi:hypothetical protein